MLTFTDAIDHHEYEKAHISIDVPDSEAQAVMSIQVGGQQVSLTSDELARLNSIMASYERSIEAFNAKS